MRFISTTALVVFGFAVARAVSSETTEGAIRAYVWSIAFALFCISLQLTILYERAKQK